MENIDETTGSEPTDDDITQNETDVQPDEDLEPEAPVGEDPAEDEGGTEDESVETEL